MFRALLTLVASVLRSALAVFRSRENQAIVELALRQQLASYVHRHPRPRLSPLDRAFWVTLSRVWPQWRSALVIVRPETVIRWHRKAFRGYWRGISKPGPGRPPITIRYGEPLHFGVRTVSGLRLRALQPGRSMVGPSHHPFHDDARLRDVREQLAGRRSRALPAGRGVRSHTEVGKCGNQGEAICISCRAKQNVAG